MKKAALDYASIKFKDKSFELVALFKVEALKMLEKYTFLRDEMIKREELAVRAANYSILQEVVIQELRNFIEETITRPDEKFDAEEGVYRAVREPRKY